MKMNKKAQISKSLADFVGYGAFVIVFLLFLLLFNMSSIMNKLKGPATNEITGFSFNEVNSGHILLNFLNSDVYLPEGTIKMSDYVVLAASAGSLNNYPLILKQLDAYFATFDGCYSLAISKGVKIIPTITKKTKSCAKGVLILPYAIVSIPTIDNDVVEVRLSQIK